VRDDNDTFKKSINK